MGITGEYPFHYGAVDYNIGGTDGKLVLYLLGYTGGRAFLDAYVRRFPKQQPGIEKCIDWLNKRESLGVFLAKLLPMVRTLISIPAGIIRMNFLKYTVSSALGIFLWNLAFVGAGYLLGDAVFTYFT